MQTNCKPVIFLLLFTISVLYGVAQTPKLIEFGWDHPDVDQLSKTLPSMQNTPFDGICFSFEPKVMEAFDTVARDEKYFKVDKLKKLNWGKYTDNFIIIRGFGITGGQWFENDAWKLFTANMKAVSRAMAAGNIKGIFFDPEYYYDNPQYNPWTYNKKQYPNQSFEEVKAAAKKRGGEFIAALQSTKSDFSFLSIWITSLIVEEKKFKPVQDSRHAILIPFFEGILEAKNKAVKIIDGDEYGYWFKKPSQFLESKAYLRDSLVNLLESQKAKAEALNVGIAQPLFYDGLVANVPAFDKGYSNDAKWKWLEENVRYALASADEYVWFYSQRLKWWDTQVNDTLVQILQNAKSIFTTANNSQYKTASTVKKALGSSITANDGKGYYYYTDPKNPMKTGDAAFSFKWLAATKKLQIDFAGKKPASVTVFFNNEAKNTVAPVTGSSVNFQLPGFSFGKIVILAKYGDGIEASGIAWFGKQ